MIAACLILVFFAAPRSSRFGRGATPFSQTPALFPSTALGATRKFCAAGDDIQLLLKTFMCDEFWCSIKKLARSAPQKDR
jgi:hypothetical protein